MLNETNEANETIDEESNSKCVDDCYKSKQMEARDPESIRMDCENSCNELSPILDEIFEKRENVTNDESTETWENVTNE